MSDFRPSRPEPRARRQVVAKPGQVPTLKKPRQFDRIFKHGRSQQRDGLVVYVARSSQPGARFGYCVSSKVGGAIIRNRLRRQLREVVRAHRREIKSGWDCILMARASILTLRYPQLEGCFVDLGKRLGLLAQ